ncbi:MAG TPA: hypothetical protein DDW67_04040, partial [Elusimicrobia bacterium]|nr:hypothetical protein [Elusimicrobiota bacterium]
GDGAAWVFVPAGDTARRVPVKTGIATADFTQVDGVKEGDEVITFGLYGLKDGSKIKAQN